MAASVVDGREGSGAKTHAANNFEKDCFILKQLVTKDFKLKYRRSVLGVVWSVLNPLLMMLVMAAVFSFFLRFGDLPHYPLYLIVGNVCFQLMNDSTTSAMTSIIGAAGLLKKVKVDRWVFPLQKALFALVNMAFSLVAVVLVMVFLRVPPTIYLLWLPAALLLETIFCAGVGMLLSSLAVFFRDIIHLWGVVITAWSYVTPIFWPVSMMDSVAPAIKMVMLVNPMYNYVTLMRDAIYYAGSPEPVTLIMCVGWAVVALALGYFVFHKQEHKFILFV